MYHTLVFLIKIFKTFMVLFNCLKYHSSFPFRTSASKVLTNPLDGNSLLLLNYLKYIHLKR